MVLCTVVIITTNELSFYDDKYVHHTCTVQGLVVKMTCMFYMLSGTSNTAQSLTVLLWSQTVTAARSNSCSDSVLLYLALSFWFTAKWPLFS